MNAVAPGFIRTDMTDKLPEAVQDNAVGQIPLTGQVLCVDGGMAM